MITMCRNLTSQLPQLPSIALALSAGLAVNPAPAFAQEDALLEAAVPSELATHSLLLDLDQVGNKLVAVGERGHILISQDNANSWQQMPVPVRVTLTASYFVDETHGWAVGHDGVVLHTSDGGNSWQKQLDGEQANQLMLEHAQAVFEKSQNAIQTASPEQQSEQEIQLENLEFAVQDAESFVAEGASRPFLDVWFRNKQEGFVIGAFGLILHTDDGGDSWQPWTEQINNPNIFHLNAIRPVGDSLYIAAEAGSLFRSEDQGDSWTELNSPYDGTFFGIAGAGDNAVIAYGLRGNAFISHNQGDNWQPIDTGINASLFGSTRLPSGSVVLTGNGGISLQVNPEGQVTHINQTASKLPLSAVIHTKDTGLLSVGLGGIQAIASLTSQPERSAP